MTEATRLLRVDDAALDAAAAAVLADKYGYTPDHTEAMRGLDSMTWRSARHDAEIVVAALPAAVAPVAVIDEFKGEYRFLSSFWPLDNVDRQYTAEHWYQAEKTVVPAERCAIIECTTPGKAKRLGMEITARPDWDEVKLDVMRGVLQKKFSLLPWMGERLLATGSAVLVEGNDWCDTYWGVCRCTEHNGEGANWLGLLLMETRNELRTGQS